MICIELEKAFEKAENINVYNDGEVITYSPHTDGYKSILKGWTAMIENAHLMPAFGVSLNNETVKAMKKGLWVEFDFNKLYESNGLPYEKLLIEVNSGYSGFNLIRYMQEYGYDGRCFYYDLVSKDMSSLYNLLINL
ncbi:MAG: hypothetical protein K2I30_03690 [Clostridia bacterium]|nr:hypothetical protein [Clostridia bacterium]